MKALSSRFGQPLAHPEFTLPGFLLLSLGIGFGLLATLLGTGAAIWLLAALMLAAGVTLLMKTRLGTALLIATLTLSLCDGAGRIEWSAYGLVQLALGLACMAGMAFCVVAQFQFHRDRGKQRPIAFVLPPQN